MLRDYQRHDARCPNLAVCFRWGKPAPFLVPPPFPQGSVSTPPHSPKSIPASFSPRLEELNDLVRENDYLRQEIVYYKSRGAMLNYWGIKLDDVEEEDLVVLWIRDVHDHIF